MSAPNLVICRSIADLERCGDTIHGARRGYFCCACGTEVVAWPGGQAAIAAGGPPYCVPCGDSILKRLDDAGKQIEIQLSPEAAEWLKQQFKGQQ